MGDRAGAPSRAITDAFGPRLVGLREAMFGAEHDAALVDLVVGRVDLGL
jgi:hypothetical protein